MAKPRGLHLFRNGAWSVTTLPSSGECSSEPASDGIVAEMFGTTKRAVNVQGLHFELGSN